MIRLIFFVCVWLVAAGKYETLVELAEQVGNNIQAQNLIVSETSSHRFWKLTQEKLDEILLQSNNFSETTLFIIGPLEPFSTTFTTMIQQSGLHGAFIITLMEGDEKQLTLARMDYISRRTADLGKPYQEMIAHDQWRASVGVSPLLQHFATWNYEQSSGAEWGWTSRNLRNQEKEWLGYLPDP